MVFVKVRETYDLHTTQNKMTVIGIHTPKPDIIKRNYSGLLMQCRAYRPVSADVAISCASMLPLDPLGVGTSEGDIAPEDVFNPILYKAISNKGMSQLEARINNFAMSTGGNVPDVNGSGAFADTDSITSAVDEFPIYYGLLSETNTWKHAMPQSGLTMTDLKPLVYEYVWNIGDSNAANANASVPQCGAPGADNNSTVIYGYGIPGKAKEMPFINCTSYTYTGGSGGSSTYAASGFVGGLPNCEQTVPWVKVMCGAIIIPPSRLHELYFRMTVVWNLEFSALRPVSEICNFNNLADLGNAQHYQNYSYESAKAAITGSDQTILTSDACMVSSNAEVKQVM